MSEKEELVRLHDERLAIFEFGKLIEEIKAEDNALEYIMLDFKDPRESPDAILHKKYKNTEPVLLNVEFE